MITIKKRPKFLLSGDEVVAAKESLRVIREIATIPDEYSYVAEKDFDFLHKVLNKAAKKSEQGGFSFSLDINWLFVAIIVFIVVAK